MLTSRQNQNQNKMLHDVDNNQTFIKLNNVYQLNGVIILSYTIFLFYSSVSRLLLILNSSILL